MHALDRLIPAPRVLEIDAVDIAAPVHSVWETVRHGDLARTPLIRALFTLRDLPERIAGTPAEDHSLRIDRLKSTPEHPGFQLLIDAPPQELAVGAIGKVWQPRIPFVHVSDARAFEAFNTAGFIKVAWALLVERVSSEVTRLTIELRVDATDEHAWHDFQRYFLFIGPASRFIRHSALASLARELDQRAAPPARLALPGDECVPDASAEITHDITIEAPPEAIWPWLMQMGCDRAGFYSLDLLDNAAVPSAREVHAEWQRRAVGDRIPATPDGSAHFEILRMEAPHTLVLGSLVDADGPRPFAFHAQRPERYWHVSWAFVSRAESSRTTRLFVRARAAFSSDRALHAAWIRPVHQLMESVQLHNLKARVEGSLARDSMRDVWQGLGGALRIAWELVAPHARTRHMLWGVGPELAARSFPGDEFVPRPEWSWTHGIEVSASAADVWPWIAQIGANHGGFYSYQWLENLVGCELRNAETIHQGWTLELGDELVLHPSAPPLKIAAIEPGQWFVARAAAERVSDQPWADVSWLFMIEALGAARCRVLSRFRVAHSPDLATRVAYGPTFLRPIGFAMDRRMLLGIRERAERAAQRP